MENLLGKDGLYIVGKFEEAVRILTTSRGTINDRLVDAGKVLIWIPESDLRTVDGVDEDIRWILERLRAREAYREQSVVRGVHLWDQRWGPVVAQRIFDVWRRMDARKSKQLECRLAELNRPE